MFNKIFCKNEVNLNLFLKNFIKKPAFKYIKMLISVKKI